ncbi:hypothetical protein [Nitrospira sp. M1]
MRKSRQIAVVVSAILGITTLATTALANPAMLPDHPGHPMKVLKDPVRGQSLANDAGRSNYFGQEALKQSSMAGNEDLKTLSDVAQELDKKNEGLSIATESQDSQQNQ